MDRRISALGLAGLIFLMATVTSLSAAPFFFRSEPKATIQWHHDLKAARKIAAEQNKPLLIVFGASWCKYCVKMEKETLSDTATVNWINEQFIPVHLDADKDRKIARTLEVESLPATVVLNPDADLLANIVGYQSKSQLRRGLQEAVDFDRALQEKKRVLLSQRTFRAEDRGIRQTSNTQPARRIR